MTVEFQMKVDAIDRVHVGHGGGVDGSPQHGQATMSLKAVLDDTDESKGVFPDARSGSGGTMHLTMLSKDVGEQFQVGDVVTVWIEPAHPTPVQTEEPPAKVEKKK